MSIPTEVNTMDAVQTLHPRDVLDRVLFSITGLRPGEALAALLLAANVFVLLGSYYLLKTIREALILSEAGAEVKSYSAAGQALLLLAVVPVHGFVASRVNRSRLISWVTLFCISHLGIFYVLDAAGVPIGVPFFLWVGVFIPLVITQFWSFASDLYDSGSGSQIFPIIGIGSSLGAWVGARAAARLFMVLAANQLLLVAGFGLLVSLLITCAVDRKSKQPAAEAPICGKGGFQLIVRSRYLLLIALMVLTSNMVNSLGEFMLGQFVVSGVEQDVASGILDASEKKATIGAFYGEFFGAVNLIGLLLQVFVVSRIFKNVGVRGALFVLPLIALGSYGLTAFLPVLGIVKVAKVLENSTNYSIQNTTRHALFLPSSREAKYKAKAAIDTFFCRAGDVLHAAIVMAGTHLAFSMRQFSGINMALIGVWLLLLLHIYRENQRMVPYVRNA